MSKKHFIAIAATIKDVYTQSTTDAEKSTVRLLAKRFCVDFLADNPRFDSDRFLDACGIN